MLFRSPEANSPNVSRHIGCWNDCVLFASFVGDTGDVVVRRFFLGDGSCVVVVIMVCLVVERIREDEGRDKASKHATAVVTSVICY